MSDVADQRFAPPQAQVADLAPEGAVLAERGTRFLAAVVDGLIGAGVVWVAFQIPALERLVQAQTAATLKSMWSPTPLSLAVGLLAFLVIQGWPLVTRGQTLGKILFKLRIVRSDGSKPGAWRLLGLRYGVGMLAGVNPIVAGVYGLVDSLLIFRESRKCLHDTIADTQVIKL
ncbi:RDD family protein [Roseateles sp.]|uniref:RDD family protein n=1 Tax=Roseateles sp. TaxID=1971397 RepID=UPI003264C7CE